MGDAFDLQGFEGNSPWIGDSGEAIWQLYVTSNGKARQWVASLAPSRREALHAAWVNYFEAHRVDDRIQAPRAYVVVVGHRRWPLP